MWHSRALVRTTTPTIPSPPYRTTTFSVSSSQKLSSLGSSPDDTTNAGDLGRPPGPPPLLPPCRVPVPVPPPAWARDEGLPSSMLLGSSSDSPAATLEYPNPFPFTFPFPFTLVKPPPLTTSNTSESQVGDEGGLEDEDGGALRPDVL